MVDHGASDFNYQVIECDPADDWGTTTFCTDTLAHCAARSGNVEIVKYLHSKGTKFDVKTENGATPLDVAVGEDVIAFLKSIQ